jgi:hypothetical protein
LEYKGRETKKEIEGEMLEKGNGRSYRRVESRKRSQFATGK